MQEAHVRLAERHDVPVLVALMTAFYGEAGYELPEQAATRAFVALFADPRLGRVWLVEKDQVPVGYLVLTLGFSMEFGGVRGFVDDLFVSPPARGNGLGAALLAEVRRACKELGVCALLVETGPEDHPARRLYARAGFQENAGSFSPRRSWKRYTTQTSANQLIHRSGPTTPDEPSDIRRLGPVNVLSCNLSGGK